MTGVVPDIFASAPEPRTVRHHPDEELLIAYAAGQYGAPMRLLLATHLSFCDICRREVAFAERLGGALLESLPPAPLDVDSLAQTLARLDGAVGRAAQPRLIPDRVGVDTTPAPLRAWLGRDMSRLRWRKMGPRLSYVPLLRDGQTRMNLLRGVPGADTGAHRHRGMEYTLVLAGGYTDVTGSYGPGDLQISPPDLYHDPVADPEGDCINLSVATGPMLFDGLAQKIAGRLFGF